MVDGRRSITGISRTAATMIVTTIWGRQGSEFQFETRENDE